MPNDATTTLQTLKDARTAFSRERGWMGSIHAPRNLAISIIIEAAELLEHFQWDEYDPTKKQEIADELADVLGYAVELASKLGIDLAASFFDKLERAKQKYPTSVFKPGQFDPKAYERIKQTYRAGRAGKPNGSDPNGRQENSKT